MAITFLAVRTDTGRRLHLDLANTGAVAAGRSARSSIGGSMITTQTSWNPEQLPGEVEPDRTDVGDDGAPGIRYRGQVPMVSGLALKPCWLTLTTSVCDGSTGPDRAERPTTPGQRILRPCDRSTGEDADGSRIRGRWVLIPLVRLRDASHPRASGPSRSRGQPGCSRADPNSQAAAAQSDLGVRADFNQDGFGFALTAGSWASPHPRHSRPDPVPPHNERRQATDRQLPGP